MSNPDAMFDWRKAILKSDLPPTTRHVLLTLACHMNPMGESCFPSIKLLCEETGLSNRAVITHLQNATEIGWITVGKHGFGGQRWAAHEYRPAWPHHLRSAAESFAKAVNEVHHVKEKAVNEVHQLSNKAVNVVPKGGEPHDIKAVNEVHTSTPYSNPDNKPSSSDKSGKDSSDAANALQAACKATWQSYSDAYEKQYGIPPIRNASVSTAIRAFCKKVPHHEAPKIAAFYVSHNNNFYVQKTHSVFLMSKDAEGLRTQWATGRLNGSAKPGKFDSSAYVNRNARLPGEKIEKPIN